MKTIVAGAFSAATLIASAHAQSATVEMLNVDPESRQTMVFKPALVTVAPGETVTWKPTDFGHNVEFIKGAIPEGVDAFRSDLNKEVSFTFQQEGVYLYKCSPHYGAGMVGVVIVGDSVDPASVIAGVKAPPLSKRRLEAAINVN